MLEVHQRKWIPHHVWDVLQTDLDHRARIGVRIVAFRGRPAVDHHFTLIGSARSDNATGAHAKRKYATVIHLFHQIVIGGRKVFAPDRAMVLRLVNDFLGVFNTYPEGEGLGLDKPAFAVEQLEYIPSGMSG